MDTLVKIPKQYLNPQAVLVRVGLFRQIPICGTMESKSAAVVAKSNERNPSSGSIVFFSIKGCILQNEVDFKHEKHT